MNKNFNDLNNNDLKITDEDEEVIENTGAEENLSIDKIIINLKIIALIKKYEKLSINNNNTLIIDDHYNLFYIQSIKRWLNNDNRQKTINYIEKIIQRTFDCMDDIYNEFKNELQKKNDVFEEDKENLLFRLSKEIINASEGLKNLRITYKYDSLINSQIQLILDKIRIKINKLNELLNIKWIIDKEYQSGGHYGE